MEIQLSISNPKRAFALLEFLKASDLIDTFKILETQPNTIVSKSKTPETGVSFFDKFYGSVKSGMTLEQIDQHLNELRKEWERDI